MSEIYIKPLNTDDMRTAVLLILLISSVILVTLWSYHKYTVYSKEGLRLANTWDVIDYDDFLSNNYARLAFFEGQYSSPKFLGNPRAIMKALTRAYSENTQFQRLLNEKELNDTQFITQAFWFIAKRAPTFLEGNYYTNLLVDRRASREEIMKMLMYKESTIKIRMLEDFWRKYYGRKMNTYETKAWAEKIKYTNVLTDMNLLEAKIANSPEAIFRRGVYTLYDVIIKRQPTPDEYFNYLTKWYEGLTTEDVKRDLLNSMESTIDGSKPFNMIDAVRQKYRVASEVGDLNTVSGRN